MKVHITLVGRQAAPVYHGIVATQPDLVVLVYSKDTTSSLNRLTANLSIPIRTIPLHPTDANLILSTAQNLAQQYANEVITVNISSGLKSWSHLFGITFQPLPNAHVVYMDQNNILWDYKTMTSRDDYKFDMDILFKLYGNPLNDYHTYNTYTNEDYNAVKTIESMRKYNYAQFNELTALLTKEQANTIKQKQQGKLISSDETAFVQWNKTDNWVLLSFSDSSGRNKREEFIQSPNVMNLVFNSGWFEYKVANILFQWPHAKEIRINCKFPLPDNNKYTKNEIDIIVNAGRKLLFVECKTNISSALDIDKFRTAVNTYGGQGSKALFVTNNKMNALQIEKCKDSSIIPFSLADTSYTTKQALFTLLNKNLLSINA